MTLIELQNVLGKRIEICCDENISDEDRRRENEISQIVALLAKQMINNADIVLRTDKLVAEGKITNSNIEKMVK